MDHLSFTPDEFAALVTRYPAMLEFPILLRGAHGIGKSAAPRKLAKNLSLPLIERRISQLSEGDFLGLPVQSPITDLMGYPHEDTTRRKGMNSSTGDFTPTATTRFSPPDWFWQACTTPVVLFLDEIGRGSQELTQAVMQLLDSRTLGGMVLHPRTILIAADNSGEAEELAAYKVDPMDAALLSRFSVFDIVLTKSAWLAWAAVSGIHPKIMQFQRQCAGKIQGEEFYPLYLKENPTNRVTPCPRSWERLNTVISPLLDSPGYHQRDPKILDDLYLLSAPFIGATAANEFVIFLREKENALSHEDVVAGKFPPADAEIPYLQGLVQGVVGNYAATPLTHEQATNIMEFLLLLGDELASTLYWGFAKRTKENAETTTRNCRLLTGHDTEGNPRDIHSRCPLTGEYRNPTPLVRAKIAGFTSAKTR